MHVQKPASLQEIVKRRQEEAFWGRKEQLSLFSTNLALPLEDDRRRFVFEIVGQAGVGKTWLMRRFSQLAEAADGITAWTDDVETDIPEVLGQFAEQFEQHGLPLKTFRERYRSYRQHRQELESDPSAPKGLPALMGRTLAKAGIGLARVNPLSSAVVELVGEDAITEQVSEWAIFVSQKLNKPDEVRLVLEPVDVLTPLFLKEIREGGDGRLIALFFDTYEKTSSFLDGWIRDLFQGRHGEVPAEVVFAISSQEELNKNFWSPFEAILAHLPLEPFTDGEAREYLTHKGITDLRVVEVILTLSGRLPLLLATLASESPTDPTQIGDPSGTAVERFLKWVQDPRKRQVALDGAIPLTLNRDVTGVLVGESEADSLFRWLKDRPFVQESGDGWIYHGMVRSQMLRYKHRESPESCARLHGQLAKYFETLRDNLGLEEGKGLRDSVWQQYSLRTLYHRLSEAPQKGLYLALRGFMIALAAQVGIRGHPFAHEWAEMITRAGTDAGISEVQRWGIELSKGLTDYENGSYAEAIGLFTKLLAQFEMGSKEFKIAVDWRGYVLP